MNFQSLESKLTEACAAINTTDPKSRPAVSALYEVTFNLFRCCLRMEDRLNGWEKAFPPAEVCECECEPDPILCESIPKEIKDAAWLIENWMKQNGHSKWKLMGIQSREDG